MFYLYILRSIKFGTYYIGSCENIKKRLYLHNHGDVKSTNSKSPWTLIYKEQYPTRSAARRREKQLKSWKSRLAIERLIKHL